MQRLQMICGALLVVGLSGACADTDVENTQEAREELGAGEGRDIRVTPVDLENQRWFQEGRTVEFGGRSWLVTGEPIYDPAVEPVGTFEGMTLYAEAGTAGPHSELFIPLENDQWQRLTPTEAAAPTDEAAPDVPQGAGGIDPKGDPTGAAEGTP